jgi:hypothetical protein
MIESDRTINGDRISFAKELPAGVQFNQQLQNVLICRAEVKVGNLPGEDPVNGVMLQQLWNAFRNGAVKQCQADVNIRVFVYNLGKNTADGNGNIQFFLTFPNQGIFQCFTGFNLTAYELPQKGSCFIDGALTY